MFNKIKQYGISEEQSKKILGRFLFTIPLITNKDPYEGISDSIITVGVSNLNMKVKQSKNFSGKKTGYNLIKQLLNNGFNIETRYVYYRNNLAIIDLLNNGIDMKYMNKIDGINKLKSIISNRKKEMNDALYYVIVEDVAKIIESYMVT